MPRRRQEDEEPISLEEVRQFARDLVMSREMRAHVAKKALIDDKVLLAMLKLATDEPDPSAKDGTQLPPSVNVRILNAVMAMPPDVRRHFAETGELPERYWEQPWHGGIRKP